MDKPENTFIINIIIIISSEFSILHVDTYVKILILNYLLSIKFHGIMVKIPDFLFGALSLSLNGTFFCESITRCASCTYIRRLRRRLDRLVYL